MRKILFLFLLAAFSQGSFAQFNTVQFTPVTFTGEDEVTFTIDLTGTSLAGESEVYIWIFANSGSTDPQYPSRDGVNTNTDWGNSPAAAKFTHVSGNIWSYTFTGAEMFNLTPGQLNYFQFLVKTKTGNKQTSDSPRFPFAPVAFVPSVYRIFPSFVGQDDAVTLFFYQDLSSDLIESRMQPKTITVTVYDENDNQFGSPMDFEATSVGNGVYKFKSFIPTTNWSVPAGTTLSRFTYVVNGTDLNTTGQTIDVSGPLKSRTFDILQ